MSEHDGTVVALSEAPGAPFAVVFLTTEETLWVTEAPRRFRLDVVGGGPARLRLSAMAELVTGAAHAVRGRSGAATQVPVNLAVTLEPAAMATPSPQEIRPVLASGWLTVGSVFRTVRGLGWSSAVSAEGVPGCRARAVFQDRSGVFLADQPGGGVTAVVMAGIASRPVSARRRMLHRTDHGGPARRVGYTLEGRRPAQVSAEIRDIEQHLTFVEPALGGGWRSWSGAPAVFVRSGVTGLGLVELCSPVEAPDPAPLAASLPDPY